MEIIWTKTANRKLQSIAEFIAKENYERAVSFAGELFDRTDQLSHQPDSGRIVPEFNNPNVRELLHGNYRIIYEFDQSKGMIYIKTIFHTRQLLSDKISKLR